MLRSILCVSLSPRASVLALFVLATSLVACDSSPLVAPTDSTIVLLASPAVVPVNSSVELTAVVSRPGGTAVQNGTRVVFSSTLGSLDPKEATTRDGKATVTLRAGTTAGTATVGAVSGEAIADPIEVTIVG